MMSEDKKILISNAAKITAIVAGVITVVGIVLAAIVKIQTTPVIIMCFGGLFVAFGAVVTSSVVTEFFDEDDYIPRR